MSCAIFSESNAFRRPEQSTGDLLTGTKHRVTYNQQDYLTHNYRSIGLFLAKHLRPRLQVMHPKTHLTYVYCMLAAVSSVVVTWYSESVVTICPSSSDEVGLTEENRR